MGHNQIREIIALPNLGRSDSDSAKVTFVPQGFIMSPIKFRGQLSLVGQGSTMSPMTKAIGN